MQCFALDIGTRRTGVACGDDVSGALYALETIEHVSQQQLLDRVHALLAERAIDHVVVGLPLLPGGDEGKQAAASRRIARQLEESGHSVSLLDERYSTPDGFTGDRDAAAACALLETFLSRQSGNNTKK